jgi:hypothetical protein
MCVRGTSVPKETLFGAHTFRQSLITTMVPFCWSTHWSALVATEWCSSGPLSPASVSHTSTVWLSSVVVLVSLSAIGASFTAVAVIVNV